MTIVPVASAIRPGEHACCRFERPEERERVADAFVRGGPSPGHRVIYLCDREEVEATLAHLASMQVDVPDALRGGRLQVRDARDVYMRDGAFGMRALRGSLPRHLVIAAASDPVRRIIGLLGWDTVPTIQVAA